MPDSSVRKKILEAALKALLAAGETAWWLKAPATFVAELSPRFDGLSSKHREVLTDASTEELQEALLQISLATQHSATAASAALRIEAHVDALQTKLRDQEARLDAGFRKFAKALAGALRQLRDLISRIDTTTTHIHDIVTRTDSTVTASHSIMQGLSTELSTVLKILSSRLGFATNALTEDLAESVCSDEIANERIPSLIRLLKSSDADDKIHAARALAKLGPSAGNAVPALIGVLDDSVWIVTLEAVHALGSIGPVAASESVPAIGSRLKGWNVHLVDAAISSFGKLGPQAVPHLVAIFRAAASWRETILRTLQKMGSSGLAATPNLIAVLEDHSEQDQLRALVASVLAEITIGTSRAVAALSRAVTVESTAIRSSALLALGRLGRHAKPALPLIVNCLSEKSVVRAAQDALFELGPEAAHTIDEVLESTPLTTRFMDPQRIARGIAGMGTKVVPALVRSIKAKHFDTNTPVTSALFAISLLGPSASAAIPELVAILRPTARGDLYRMILHAARIAIAGIGLPAVPALLSLLRDEDSETRADAALALSDIKTIPVEALPVLEEALLDSDTRVQRGAALALSRLDSDSSTWLPTAVEAVKSNLLVTEYRSRYAVAILRAGKAAVPVYVEMLGLPDLACRVWATEGLQMLGQDAVEAVPALNATLKDSSKQVRTLAACALSDLGLRLPGLLTILMEGIQDLDLFFARRKAYESLGNLGAEAAQAIPLLEALAERREEWHSTPAGETLRRIRGAQSGRTGD